MTTVTTFATAVDVTLAELKLEAFLPADQATAEALQLAGGLVDEIPGEHISCGSDRALLMGLGAGREECSG